MDALSVKKAGCRRERRETQTEEREFSAYLDRCLEGFRRRQTALVEEQGLLSYETYRYSRGGDRLRLERADGEAAVFDMIPVGSYSASNGFWVWSWANTGNPQGVRTLAACWKDLAAVTGLAQFETGMFPLEEQAVEGLLAMCLDRADALGAWRIESGDGKVATYCILTRKVPADTVF